MSEDLSLMMRSCHYFHFESCSVSLGNLSLPIQGHRCAVEASQRLSCQQLIDLPEAFRQYLQLAGRRSEISLAKLKTICRRFNYINSLIVMVSCVNYVIREISKILESF